MGKDVFEMIRDFGGRGKIFEVHFRNVSSPLPHFVETFPDDGYMDMYQVMKGSASGSLQWRRRTRPRSAIGRRLWLAARWYGLLHRLHASTAASGQ